MKSKLFFVIMVVIAVSALIFFYNSKTVEKAVVVTNFEECAKAGNPVMESYPRQCRHEKTTYTEFIGNILDKSNFIELSSPRPNDIVKSPLLISGKARGTWFFEASFPIFITDWDGLIIGQGIATAKSDWMTEEFVPFEATITFTNPTYGENGTLILKKDNPSGLPEHDDALEIPIKFDIVK